MPTIKDMHDDLRQLRDHIREDMAESRASTREDVNPLRTDMMARLESVRAEFVAENVKIHERLDVAGADMKKIQEVMTKAQGGWLVIVGFGALAGALIKFWDKLPKFWA